MKSYDYSHFEISLSADLQPGLIASETTDTAAQVDELRKTAARLADKSVAQYKVAKANAELMERDAQDLDMLRYRHREVLKKPEGERTPEDKAILKAIADRAHRMRPRYDYEDDWDERDYPQDDEGDL